MSLSLNIPSKQCIAYTEIVNILKMKLPEVVVFVLLWHNTTYAWNIPGSKFLSDVVAQFSRLNLVFHVPEGTGSDFVKMYKKELQ